VTARRRPTLCGRPCASSDARPNIGDIGHRRQPCRARRATHRASFGLLRGNQRRWCIGFGQCHAFPGLIRVVHQVRSCCVAPISWEDGGVIGQMLGFQLHAMGRCPVNQGMGGDCPRPGLNPAASPYRRGGIELTMPGNARAFCARRDHVGLTKGEVHDHGRIHFREAEDVKSLSPGHPP